MNNDQFKLPALAREFLDKQRARSRYKGYLNPKAALPQESILYHIGSLFLALLVFSILYFSKTEPMIASACSVIFALALFLMLFKLNNYLFERDKEILEHLVVYNKVDNIALLSIFFKDIQSVFEMISKPYLGTGDGVDPAAVGILTLFQRIFREDAELLLYQFKVHNGNFFRFIELLSPLQREVLYRYYLHREYRQ